MTRHSTSIFPLFLLSQFLSDVIEYNTIIIESAIDVAPESTLQQGPITQHFNIITADDGENDKLSKNHNENDQMESVTITKVQIEPTTVAAASATSVMATATRPKEIISYQRFGRIDKKTVTYPFKCHLCGFSCRFKESLISHLKQHPYWSDKLFQGRPSRRIKGILLEIKTSPTNFSNRIVQSYSIKCNLETKTKMKPIQDHLMGVSRIYQNKQTKKNSSAKFKSI